MEVAVSLGNSMPDYDEFDDEFSEPRNPHRRFIRFGLFIAMISMVGMTVAANITINDGAKLEFGQGIYKIKTCDQFVGISLNPTETYADGYSRVLNVTIKGLDVSRCANTSIRIKLFKDGSASPLDLFTNPSYTKSGITYPCCTETGTAVTLVIAAGATQGTALQNTTLLSPSGKNIAQGDRSQSLSYDANAAVFTVAFAVPLAVMREVSGTTLESAPNV